MMLLLLTTCQQASSIVVIETDLGNISIRLYDDTPLHKKNFLKLTEMGYFNELAWDRVIQDLFIEGGDLTTRDTNTNGQTPILPVSPVPPEIKHLPLRGALVGCRDIKDPSKQSNGSEFFLIQGTMLDEKRFQKLTKNLPLPISEQEKQVYLKWGGAPQFHGNYTVFGAVISGMNVIDKIAAVPRDAKDRPLVDIRMRVFIPNK